MREIKVRLRSSDGYNYCKLKGEQYTGLKDKNGTKIFEGDIVKCIYFQNGEDRKIIGTVEWYERGCCYLVYPNNAYNFRLESGIRELEVVGNVWDNPELNKNTNIFD